MKVIYSNPISVEVEGARDKKTILYSLVFPKPQWTKQSVLKWCKEKGLIGEAEENNYSVRFLLQEAHKRKDIEYFRYSSNRWYHDEKPIMPLFGIVSVGDEVPVGFIDREKAIQNAVASLIDCDVESVKDLEIGEKVMIERNLKVTPQIVRFIRENLTVKPSILKSMIKGRFFVDLSTTTISKIKSGEYKNKTLTIKQEV